MFTVSHIEKIRYKPSLAAEEFLGDLKLELNLDDKATAARLAIARSISEPIKDDDLAIILNGQNIEKGKPIEGQHLFGDDSSVWGVLISSSIENIIDKDTEFRNLVEFHWHRGSELLRHDYQSNGKNIINFIIDLSSKISQFIGTIPNENIKNSTFKNLIPLNSLVEIKILENFDPWKLNSTGGNGLMVISGRPGTGKSQLALDLLAQASACGAKFLFFDLKGELEDSFDNKQQKQKREDFLIQTNAKYTRLIDSKLPINPLIEANTDYEKAQIASEISHLVKCFASQLGANQETVIRDIYKDLNYPDISGIVEELRNRGEEGVALSIFDKLNSFGVFSDHDSSIPLEDWLSNSLVIDFKGLGNDNETKSLIVAFILNVIMRKLNKQLPIENGVQPLQMILFVDEAHLLLPKEGKAGLLGSLARQGRSWGFPVWLASQDADAFITKGQHSTDFAELADCGIHLSPSTLSDSQQRQILGQVLNKKLNDGEGVLRLRGTTSIGKIMQYFKNKGKVN
jgi:hypothetical protein